MTSINIKVKNPTELFSIQNTAPDYFSQKVSDACSMGELLEKVESASDQELLIEINIKDKQGKTNTEIEEAIKFYCKAQIEEKQNLISKMKSRGKRYTAKSIARILVLIVCSVILASGLSAIKLELLLPFLAATVSIISWMLIWQPVELWTYDWWELADEIAILENTRRAKIIVD